MILVLVLVDGRDLALAEGVVQGAVDLGGIEPQPRRGLAVDLQIDLKALVRLVRIDVLQLRHVLQRGGDLGYPFIEIVQGVALDRILIGRETLAAAGADLLCALQEQPGARHLVQLRPQPVDHLVGGARPAA
jgi:hypothetical protein